MSKETVSDFHQACLNAGLEPDQVKELPETWPASPNALGALLGQKFGMKGRALREMIEEIEFYRPTEVLHPPVTPAATHQVNVTVQQQRDTLASRIRELAADPTNAELAEEIRPLLRFQRVFYPAKEGGFDPDMTLKAITEFQRAGAALDMWQGVMLQTLDEVLGARQEADPVTGEALVGGINPTNKANWTPVKMDDRVLAAFARLQGLLEPADTSRSVIRDLTVAEYDMFWQDIKTRFDWADQNDPQATAAARAAVYVRPGQQQRQRQQPHYQRQGQYAVGSGIAQASGGGYASVSGQGRVIGTNIGMNTGTISNMIHPFDDDDIDARQSQGFVNRPNGSVSQQFGAAPVPQSDEDIFTRYTQVMKRVPRQILKPLESQVKKAEQTYSLICEYEEKIRLSSDPKEQARNRRELEQQTQYLHQTLSAIERML